MISCSDYDYIEIVCMYKYPVKLTLNSGDAIEGVALDTKRDSNRAECIEIDSSEGMVLVKLDSIKKLTVQKDNPHFSEVVFN